MVRQPLPAPAYFAAPTPLLGLNSSSCSCSSSFSSSRTHQHQHGLLHLPAASPTSTSTPLCTTRRSHDDDDASDAALLALLRAGHTDAAYRLFASTPSLPQSPTSASRLLAQLSYKSTSSSAFSRAARLLQRLRAHGALNLLDSNSLSLAASAAARSTNAHLAYSLLLSMLRRGLLPDRRAYTAALSRLRPAQALRLFDAVLHHLRRAPSDQTSFSLPDTAAFNAALSACADAGDCSRFRQLFDEMHRWSATPDALTYNVVIKMCARAGRKDLVARVLERILSSGLTPCATTFHSLVAAYVGFGDIPKGLHERRSSRRRGGYGAGDAARGARAPSNRGPGRPAARRWAGMESEEPEERREKLREVKLAGMVPVPVAAITAGSACCSSHSMVSPSVLCPNIPPAPCPSAAPAAPPDEAQAHASRARTGRDRAGGGRSWQRRWRPEGGGAMRELRPRSKNFQEEMEKEKQWRKREKRRSKKNELGVVSAE